MLLKYRYHDSDAMSASSAQVDKIVNVRMVETEHTLLKAYFSSLNRSMQDVLHDFSLMAIQKQYNFCGIVCSLIEEHGIDQDPRAKQHFAGYSYYYFRHTEACKDGETDLLFIPRYELREMLTEECAYILKFDDSSIEAPTQVGGSSFDQLVTSSSDEGAFLVKSLMEAV